MHQKHTLRARQPIKQRTQVLFRSGRLELLLGIAPVHDALRLDRAELGGLHEAGGQVVVDERVLLGLQGDDDIAGAEAVVDSLGEVRDV